MATTTDTPKVLRNGAQVLEYKQLHPGGNCWRPNGVAICHWDQSAHPFVVWRVFRNENGEWDAEAGEYYSTVCEAVDAYRLRA